MIRQRLLGLDGLRGCAAIVVVIYHCRVFFDFWPLRGYLAVDLFFIISGYVLAGVYSQDLASGNLTLSDFLCRRLMRLSPAFLFSILLCASVATWTSAYSPLFTNRAALWASIAASAVLAPSMFAQSIFIFALNPPYWSLFYELLINVGYAKFIRSLNTYVTASIIIGFAIVLVGIAWHRGNLNLGAAGLPNEVIGAVVRSTLGFLLGGRLSKIQLGGRFLESAQRLRFWTLICAAGALFQTFSGAAGVTAECVTVIIVFPVCVLISANAVYGPISSKCLEVVGLVSYPLYVIHMPLYDLVCWLGKANMVKLAPFSGVAFVLGCMLIALFVAWIVEPICRKRFGAYLKTKRS